MRRLLRSPFLRALLLGASAGLLALPETGPEFKLARNGVVCLVGALALAWAALGTWRSGRARGWGRWPAGLAVLVLVTGVLAGLADWVVEDVIWRPTRDLALTIESAGGATYRLYYHRACFLGCSYVRADLARPLGPFEVVIWRGDDPRSIAATWWGERVRLEIGPGLLKATIDDRPARTYGSQVFEEHLFDRGIPTLKTQPVSP